MFKLVGKSSLLVCVFALAACNFEESKSELPVEPALPVEKVSAAIPNFTPPSFADMVNINTPMAVVQGDHKALPYPVEPDLKLTKNLDEFVTSSDSYSVIVWRDNKIVYEKYASPYTSETRAESASMHKSVLALLIGIAIEDGFIESPQAKAGDYIPEWKNDPRGQLTIQDLLEMNSGLEPLSSVGGMNAPSMKFVMDGAAARPTILQMELTGTPGDVFHYQNASSQLLGLILENATGQDFQNYLSKHLWKPLGAKDAKVWLNEPDGFARTYTGLYAVPRDWLRLGLLVKNSGEYDETQIVPKSYVDQMISPSRANPNYGWQIWRGDSYEEKRYYNSSKMGISINSSEPYSVDDMIYFDGFGGQRVYISRSENLVIVRTGDVRMDWDDSQLPNLVLSLF